MYANIHTFRCCGLDRELDLETDPPAKVDGVELGVVGLGADVATSQHNAPEILKLRLSAIFSNSLLDFFPHHLIFQSDLKEIGNIFQNVSAGGNDVTATGRICNLCLLFRGLAGWRFWIYWQLCRCVQICRDRHRTQIKDQIISSSDLILLTIKSALFCQLLCFPHFLPVFKTLCICVYSYVSHPCGHFISRHDWDDPRICDCCLHHHWHMSPLREL